jgi:hypothetical protein
MPRYASAGCHDHDHEVVRYHWRGKYIAPMYDRSDKLRPVIYSQYRVISHLCGPAGTASPHYQSKVALRHRNVAARKCSPLKNCDFAAVALGTAISEASMTGSMSHLQIFGVLLLAYGLLALAVDPVVDLGYSKFRGRVVGDGTTQWLGMRYATPPLGRLRFSAPQPPANTSGIQDASNVCPFIPALNTC